ncbi:NADPH:quinone reductase [Novosphingobium endophyticum]|uniref:NADPH:quinone reductase n=1 Tax=Novosphingobium endophyticum TaxID=1955250 RepID=A0A916TTF5_9SPHN|nr:NADP-dependent oxidoreductase [Novosphingobium endophyticum]GGC02915.1 NADPH:quinone reductase [Novosphingobium endophyticum]
MRAIIMNGYGGADVLEMAQLPRPVPGKGETLVRIRAAAVNPADGKWRAGMFADFAPVSFPHVLGYDVAGEVESGAGFPAGTRVFGMLDPFRKGGYAEYVAAPAGQFVIMPDALAFAEAAAIPTAGLTGTQMAEDALDLKAGDRLLITGAAGAVGRFAMRAAKARRAHVVAAVRAGHRAVAMAQGADEVVALGEEAWTGAPFDHVLDTVGGEAVGQLCLHLKPGGRIVTVATTPIEAANLPAAPEFYAVQPNGAALQRLAAAVVTGALEVPIAKTMPLAEAAEAQRLVDSGGAGGKIILTP